MSFIIRAVLAGNTAAAQNESLYIAEQVLLSIGYFALLFSAYTLVMDRWIDIVLFLAERWAVINLFLEPILLNNSTWETAVSNSITRLV